MIPSREDLRHHTLALDLGASRTRVCTRGEGIVLNQPSLVATDVRTGDMLATGGAAQRMLGRAPEHVRMLRPFAGGTIRDVSLGTRLLRAMFGALPEGETKTRLGRRRKRARPNALVSVPLACGPLTEKSVTKTVSAAGARQVTFVEAPVAAAIGAGLPLHLPEGRMIVLCGAAMTQVAMLSAGLVVAGEVIPVGGDAMDVALLEHLRTESGFLLPPQALLELHTALRRGAAERRGRGDSVTVRGVDASSGQVRLLALQKRELEQALQGPSSLLVQGIRRVLRQASTALVVDVTACGIDLVGGAAVMPGLASLLAGATGTSVRVADEPELATVRGLQTLLGGRAGDVVPEPVALNPDHVALVQAL